MFPLFSLLQELFTTWLWTWDPLKHSPKVIKWTSRKEFWKGVENLLNVDIQNQEMNVDIQNHSVDTIKTAENMIK